MLYLPRLDNIGILPYFTIIHHIYYIIGKVFYVSGFIKRSTKMFNSIVCLGTFYFSLVYLTLEYLNLVTIFSKRWTKAWTYLKYISFQLSLYDIYLYRIFNVNHSRHEYSRLKTLFNIPTLFFHRYDADFRFISSILNCCIDVPCFLSNIGLRVLSYFSRNHIPFNDPVHVK